MFLNVTLVIISLFAFPSILLHILSPDHFLFTARGHRLLQIIMVSVVLQQDKHFIWAG